MNTYVKLVATAFIPFLMLFNPMGAAAADDPNLLVMGEDADEDTVPRNSRVFKRVLHALSGQMHDEGFDVYDETAVTLDDFAQGRVRRTDAELIDIARSVRRTPIDVVVVFSIYASAKDVGYTTKVKTRIEGRLLNPKSGQFLGNFETKSPREWNAKPNCNRECILEVVGDNSRIIANDLGAVLAEKLAWMTEGNGHDGYIRGGAGNGMVTDYNLIFDGFTPEEMQQVEEYLVIFSGYDSHRPSYSSQRRAEYNYKSSIGTAKLNRNLHKMLGHLDIRAVVTFSGNTYELSKITLRNKGKRPSVSDEW